MSRKETTPRLLIQRVDSLIDRSFQLNWKPFTRKSTPVSVYFKET